MTLILIKVNSSIIYKFLSFFNQSHQKKSSKNHFMNQKESRGKSLN